jgi:hypothetical protein
MWCPIGTAAHAGNVPVPAAIPKWELGSHFRTFSEACGASYMRLTIRRGCAMDAAKVPATTEIPYEHGR